MKRPLQAIDNVLENDPKKQKLYGDEGLNDEGMGMEWAGNAPIPHTPPVIDYMEVPDDEEDVANEGMEVDTNPGPMNDIAYLNELEQYVNEALHEAARPVSPQPERRPDTANSF